MRARSRPFPILCTQLRFKKRDGSERVRVWVDSLAALLGLLDMYVIEVHPWRATVDDIEHPTYSSSTSIPAKGSNGSSCSIPLCGGAMCSPAAVSKTTGGKGLHVVVPIEPAMTWDTVPGYTRAIAEDFARLDRDRYTTRSSRAGRSGKLFLDYLRNGRGNTSIGAYSPRARPGFPVAAPVTWRDVERGIRSDTFSIAEEPRARAQTRRRR